LDVRTFNRKRVISGIASIPIVGCVVNSLFELHWFAPYDRPVGSAITLLGGIVIYLFGPSLSELREYRAAKERGQQGF
jgi:hypothetical protein